MKKILKILAFPVDWFLFTVLNDDQRKFISTLISDEHKMKVKKIFSGKKLIALNKLHNIKYHLYNLGMQEKGLKELEVFYENATDPYIKRAAAWELVLWHTNQYTKQSAKKALTYIPAASLNVKNKDQLRKVSIIKAECQQKIGENEKAIETINHMLDLKHHPDLYLARANLEESIDSRLRWINKVYAYYNLAPISFSGKKDAITYDDLSTEELKPVQNADSKVSIILPAFNDEVGIQTAINSLLSQTWQNIELLVVDDCSSDDTAKVVQGYVEKDSRVKLLKTPINSGPYVARNIGLKEATGEFLTINDSDDWSHPQKIEIQVKHLIENKQVIANTSEHSRLTEEEIRLYRRGTPGKYIFPNMSSIMFRRQPVLDKLGYWDSVRFAADGEFKRRLLKQFGAKSYVDLKSGPLSLPRQSVQSLTGSSAFGYNGFFKGVRKEYVESLEYYHKQAENLYYSYPQKQRPFPVPEPMWPQREEKPSGIRHFNVVIATDFRKFDATIVNEIKKRKDRCRIGLVSINHYNLELDNQTNEVYRHLVDGDKVQMLVFGESIRCDELVIIDPAVLQYSQVYIPKIEAKEKFVVVNQLPIENGERIYYIDDCVQQFNSYFKSHGIWFPINSTIRKNLTSYFADELTNLTLAEKDWK